MSRESTEGERNALQRLLAATERLTGDFSADANSLLRPLVSEVLAESGLFLTEVIESFGWNGEMFTMPINVEALLSRLKALVYDGLEPMGRGTFASVYKVQYFQVWWRCLHGTVYIPRINCIRFSTRIIYSSGQESMRDVVKRLAYCRSGWRG